MGTESALNEVFSFVTPGRRADQQVNRAGRHVGGGMGAQLPADADLANQRRRHRNDLEDLEEKVDRLSLVCEAMWELMCDAGYTTEHLQAKVEQLDAADGIIDQKRQRVPMDCACGAKVPITAKTCTFCSLPAPTRPAFDAV